MFCQFYFGNLEFMECIPSQPPKIQASNFIEGRVCLSKLLRRHEVESSGDLQCQYQALFFVAVRSLHRWSLALQNSYSNW